MERTARIELASSAWKAEARATRPRPLRTGCGGWSRTSEGWIMRPPWRAAPPRRKIGCGGRTRTCDLPLNRRAPYRLGYTTKPLSYELVGVSGFEPLTPCARGTCADQAALHAETGRGGRISTSDPLLPRQVRSPGCATPRFLDHGQGFEPRPAESKSAGLPLADP